MIADIVKKILYRYHSANYISRKRAQFLLSLITISCIFFPLVMFYYSYIHTINPDYNYKIETRVLIPIAFALIFTLCSLLILVRGFLPIAGNLFLISWQTALWIIIFISKEESLIRLNTSVLVAASLTIIPGIIANRKRIIFYTFINISLLFIFMILFKNELNITSSAFVDYLSTNTIAFSLIGIISYSIFFINSNAILKAEQEIYERQKSEEQRNKLQAQLLQSQKLESIGLLAGGVAHDFNNILTAIHGFAEIAAQEVSDNKAARREIDEIIKASQKAKDLTQQLLAFAKIQPINIKKINLNHIITDFTKMLSRTMRGDITLKKILCENPGTIEGDPVQIEQIILNLILNSQDAMPRGGVITIETSRTIIDSYLITRQGEIDQGEYLLLSITDYGSGIDPEIIDRIFNPFFTTKEFGKGTGLGLSTVYGIVKQHRGMIHVYSETGKGTVFQIYFPLKNNLDYVDVQPVTVQQYHRGDETILAVEDDPEVRKFIATVLSKSGYKTFVAENAEKALSIASSYENSIHLLITDVLIPDMNGMQLYNKIKELRPGIKVIFISGYTSNIISQNDIDCENLNFIQKPFSINRLTGKIRELLESEGV